MTFMSTSENLHNFSDEDRNGDSVQGDENNNNCTLFTFNLKT